MSTVADTLEGWFSDFVPSSTDIHFPCSPQGCLSQGWYSALGCDSDMDNSDELSNEDVKIIPAAPVDDPMVVDRLLQADASDDEDFSLTSSEGNEDFPDVQHDHEVFSSLDSEIGPDLEEFMFNEGDNDPHAQRTLEEMLQRL
jgi:hypothetical protein